MKFSNIILLSLLISTAASCSNQRRQNFTFDPHWEGLNNRNDKIACRTTSQDFGYSPGTNHAGGAPGELGGAVQTAADPAYYAMRLPKPLTFNDQPDSLPTMPNSPTIFLPCFQPFPQIRDLQQTDPRATFLAEARTRGPLPLRKDYNTMASPAQIKANKANAKLSTGPRTAEGKARSSRNGTSHGLSAAEVIVFPGEERAFTGLGDSLAQDLRPVGAHQREVFDQLIYHAWNRRRVRSLIANMARSLGFDPAASPFADPRVTPEIAAEYERLSRYLRHHNAGYNRCVRDLRIAQTELAARLIVSPKTAAAIPPLATFSELTKQTQNERSPGEVLIGLTTLCTQLGMDSTAFAPQQALK
jgi:hypothetical protein